MNSKNILRSYGTFNNATEQSSNLRKNSYGFSRRNNFTAGEYVTRTNNEGFRKSNSGIMNTLIDNRFQFDNNKISVLARNNVKNSSWIQKEGHDIKLINLAGLGNGNLTKDTGKFAYSLLSQYFSNSFL